MKLIKLKVNEAKFMLTALVFIIILGLLIFVHELGHFLVARKNGIRVYEFGFGFPPRIFGLKPVVEQRIEKIVVQEETTDQIEKISDGQGQEIIREVITDKVTELDEVKREKKWKFIWGRGKPEHSHHDTVDAEKSTIYSVNWIPLGGFVRIKGEEGSHPDEPDSFSSRSAWTRIKVLFAGVVMNFILAWILISIVMMLGIPEAIDENARNFRDAKIQIGQVVAGSPAEKMGIKPGDEILGCVGSADICNSNFTQITDLQNFINNNKGKEVTIKIKRGKSVMDLTGIPRTEYPENQGALGISMVKTAIVKYPWYEAVIKGFTSTVDIITLIFTTILSLIKGLFVGQKVALDVSGPVGIAYLTKQVTELGFVYILQFAAFLSINLGIINGLPFPALDGGRILFILIEKIKGSPVSSRVENFFHTLGFVMLIILMIVVTFKDVLRFEIMQKIANIF